MKQIDIRIDKRTELMSVLLYVSNYRKEFPNLINHNRDNAYVKDVYEAFSNFSNHIAVQLLNEIVEKLNFCYDAPYVLATQLNEDFSVGELMEYPFKSRLQSSPLVLKFLSSIKDFAEKSEFEKFYAEHKNVYQKLIDKIKNSFNYEQISNFEKFYKIDTNRNYIVNLLPLEARSGTYYDCRLDNTFFVHLRSDCETEFSFNEKSVTNASFRIFTLCLLRNMIKKNKLEVPQSKEFDDILKSQFITINNEQFVCDELSKILQIMFNKKFLNYDEATIREKLNSFKTDNKQRVFKEYEILQDWQNSNEPLEHYLQQLLNLFKGEK